jgi:hypothetical protein
LGFHPLPAGYMPWGAMQRVVKIAFLLDEERWRSNEFALETLLAQKDSDRVRLHVMAAFRGREHPLLHALDTNEGPSDSTLRFVRLLLQLWRAKGFGRLKFGEARVVLVWLIEAEEACVKGLREFMRCVTLFERVASASLRHSVVEYDELMERRNMWREDKRISQ